MTRRPALSLLACLALTMPVGAQQLSSNIWVPPVSSEMLAQTQTVTSGTIVGTAWDSDNTPIAGANVRLRSVETGRVVATTRANDQGEFSFENVEPGNYVTELVDDDGDVLALGQAFMLGSGQTVITFVRLPARDRNFLGGIWGSTAAAAIAAAAGLGVTAVQDCSCPRISGEQ